MLLHPVIVAAVLVLAGAGPGIAPTAHHECGFPVTLTDATGTAVTIDEEPTRVVTLNPSAAQTMWEIGAREKVVGLTKYASYLEGADSRTVVSGESAIVVHEAVIDLEPDLVLAPNATDPESVAILRNAGVTVYHFPREDEISDVYTKVRTIGRLTGECEGAEDTVAWMQDRIAVAERAVTGNDRPDVLYVFFGYTAGNETFIHEIIETAGGNNLAAALGIETYGQINDEVVIEHDPEWFILNSNDPALPDSDAYNETTAVRDGNVVVIPIEHLNQPAPRIVYAITTLAQHFHPGAYAAANTTPTASPTPTVTPQSTPAPTPTATGTPTATDGQPGFGGMALLAAAIALFLTRRAQV